MALDIAQNRRERKYPLGEQILRVMWFFGRRLFALTPRPMFRTRRFVLRLYGADIGKHVRIYPSVRILFPWKLVVGDWTAIGDNALIYNPGRVVIGEKATISHNAHVCSGTHGYTDPALPLLKQPVVIGDEAWVAADVFVGPGVTIGSGAVVGARACVVKDVAPWTVVGGNPARFIKYRILDGS